MDLKPKQNTVTFHLRLWATRLILVPLCRVLDSVGLTRKLLCQPSARRRRRSAVRADPFKGYQATGRDVFICTYFKSGANWAMQIAYQIANRSRGEFEHISNVVPFPDERQAHSVDLRDESIVRASPTGLRVVKTHLDWNWVPHHPDARYICVIRDPKEVFVSAYHFTRLGALGPLMPSVATWFDYFLSPHFHQGRWETHTDSFWSRRHQPNLLILTFGEMKGDLAQAVRRIAEFMGVALSPDEFDRVCNRSTFEYMRSIDHKFRPDRTTPFAPGTGIMMRKGASGASSELLTPAQQLQIDAHFKARMTELGSDYPYGDPIRIREMLCETGPPAR